MPPSTLLRQASRVAVATLLLLAIPFVAMQFTAEVNWGPADFVVAGALLFTAGMAIVVLAPRAGRGPRRIAVVAGVLLVLAIVWAELAVGLFR